MSQTTANQKTSLATLLCRQAERFINQTLPVESEAINRQLQAAQELLQRWYRSPRENGEVPPAIIELTVRMGELEELQRKAKLHAERRRYYTRSEKFKINSLEQTIVGLRARLAASSNPQVRERLESLIRLAQAELRAVVESKLTAGQAAQRRGELQNEYRRKSAELSRSKDSQRREALTKELNRIEEEINRHG